MRLLSLGLFCFLLFLDSSVASYDVIKAVDAFEKQVINSQEVWLVVFTALSKDEAKTRGVNLEKCRRIEGELTEVAVEMSLLGIKTALVDIEDLGPIASEFNVRKRMLPSVLLFGTRARNAEVIKSDTFSEAAIVKAQVQELLKENPRNDAGFYSKITLSLGSAAEL